MCIQPAAFFPWRWFLCAVLVLSLVPSSLAAAESPASAPGTPVISLSHPRLLIPPGGWESVRQRLGQDALGRDLLVALQSRAIAVLTQPVITGERGKDKDILGSARSCQGRLVTLAMAYRLGGDARLLDRVRREIRAAAGLADWCPEHFLDTAEIALGMALTLDWLHDALTPEDRSIIREALVSKALDVAAPVYATVQLDRPHPDRRLWWANRESNWSSVCHTGMLAAALAMAEDDPVRCRPVIAGAPAYLRIPLKAYGPDGGYPEGPGYWNYGTTFQTLGMAMLESATGTDQGLFAAEPGFAGTDLYMIHMTAPSGDMYNYADVSLSWYDGVSPLLGYLGQRFHHPQAIAFHRQRLATELKTFRRSGRFWPYNLLWLAPPEAATAALPLPRDAHYEGGADVAVFRSAWNDPNALFLGVKAGSNQVGHAHLDLGSFVLDADGVRWSSELGGDDYALPEYFGRLRFTYFRTSNQGHSTLLLNDARQTVTARAPITRFSREDQAAGAVLDLSSVHPDLATGWQRQAWMLERNRVLIQDDLKGVAEGTTLYWQMVTQAEADLATDGRTATLRQHGKTLVAEILAPAEARFEWTVATPPSAKEQQNSDYGILVATAKPAADHTARILIRLRPTGGTWPAQVSVDGPRETAP